MRCVCSQAEGHEFTFPDIFADKVTEEEINAQEFKTSLEESKKLSQQRWHLQDLPPWFQ